MLFSELKTRLKPLLRLCIKALLLYLLVSGCRELLYYRLWLDPQAPNAYDHSYERTLLLQTHALQEREENEVVIFGASYVAFGIDAAVMEKELGEKVQTLGVEASMGIPVLLDLLKRTALPGDTLVYMLGTSNQSYENAIAICAALETDKELLYSFIGSRGGLKGQVNTLIWRKLYSLSLGRAVVWIESKMAKHKQIYELDSFDERGIMSFDRPGPLDSLVMPGEFLDMDDMDDITLSKLNEFAEWCRLHDITFAIAYAPFMTESIENSDKELNDFDEELRSELKVDFINRPQDTMMGWEYFYNHPSHLNSEGARLYSEGLADDIKAYMESKE